MTQKTTRRSLVASMLSLLLCITMLIGSTFAWFTDSASTGTNKITSGNLDVGLKYSYDMTSWYDAEAETEIFDKDALYEPGYTEVVYFEVENKGSLAFNYRVGTNLISNIKGINKDDKEIDLTKYIKFGIVEVDSAFANREAALKAVTAPLDFANIFVAEKSLDKKGDTQKFAMVVYMPTDVANEANHKTGTTAPSVSFGVQVIATQEAYERDSFNNEYDLTATYPDFAFVTYEEGKDLVIKGENFEAIIPSNAGLEEAEDNMALAAGTELVMNIEEAASAPSNITISAGDLVLPYSITLETKDGEKVEATTADITVKMNIGAGRTGEIKLYHYSDLVDGTSYDETTGILTFKAKEFSPYTVIEKSVITADTSWYNETDTEFVLTDAADMFGLAQLVDDGNTFAGKTVKLGADIDLQNVEWEAIGARYIPFSGSLDGQGYTISNLKITKADTADKASENRQALISSYNPVGECSIKDITIKNADITAGRGVAVLVAVIEDADLTKNPLTITNINITGKVQIDCYYAAGAIVANCQNAVKEISDITIDVSEDSYISNLENGNTCTAMCIGSVGGWVKVDKADNIVSNMNVSGKDGGIGGLFGELMGQYSVAKLSNLNYTGKVTVVEIAGSDGEGCTYSIQGKSVSFTKYFNGLLVGTPRFSVVADKDTCKSTGTLELKRLDGTVLTTNSMGEWYEEWAVDLFGASYDTAASGYAKKSFSKNYAN